MPHRPDQDHNRSALYPDYPRLGALYQRLHGETDRRVCKDLHEEACRHQPRNFFAYLGANTAHRIADELSSARLILPWLLGAAGASSGFAGFLVPVREAGVLVPQLLVAAWARRLARRRGVWLAGAALSLAALVGMAAALHTWQGNRAGWALLACLALYSLARGLCSVAGKDVVGKIVAKTRRGALMGYATAAAGLATLGVGLYMEYLRADEAGPVYGFFLLGAAALWALAMALFLCIREEPDTPDPGRGTLREAVASLTMLWRDPAFGRFVGIRALLLSSALAPPFFVLLAQQHTGQSAGLGLLIIASGLAASVSAPLWGRLSDRSSRRTLVLGSALAGLFCLLAWGLSLAGPALLSSVWVHAGLFLGISLCHGGIRLARQVYLVDMTGVHNRARYVAVSNTAIGVLMLTAGGIGLLSLWLGVAGVLAVLGVIALLAAGLALRLDEVSG